MNQVQAKIYYLISTGEVLVVTPECQGSIEATTKVQDMKVYEQLKDKNIDEIEYIELEYGTLVSTFANVKYYSIDIETKKLDCIYFTQEELDAKKLEEETRLQTEKALNDRINTIPTYINLDATSIEDLENYILQREKNKTIGVV